MTGPVSRVGPTYLTYLTHLAYLTQKLNCTPMSTFRVPVTAVAWPKKGDVSTPL